MKSSVARVLRGIALLIFGLTAAAPAPARAQQASVSTWTAAKFRVWGFVPYWTAPAKVTALSSEGVYQHVSDVLYFSGVQPKADGTLAYSTNATTHLATLKSHAALHGFRYHLAMFDTSGGDVETVWNSITSDPANRARFVSNVKTVLQNNNMTGFNFDWERPNTVAEWGNYTQLAKDLRAAMNPAGQPHTVDVSVDDYGFASSLWDDSPVFDAAAYDQLFIMGYHYPAYSGDSLNNDHFADTKLNLTGQGAAKAFKNEQLVMGIGTWGDNGPATVRLREIVAANPNLPADALSFTGTIKDIFGNTQTGTWDIESRYQVRDKVQLALDRNMAGMMSWTLDYDATNNLSLHRVAHHYLVFKRGVPDMNLDGVVSAADADTLSNNMGTVPGWTGTNTQARFENFYIRGNWEKGDRDGNGFVNQQDADWLAARFTTFGVELPDRLAYTGTFEKLQNSKGLNGRWQAVRTATSQLPETGNYIQRNPGYLSFAGTGPGAVKFSNSSVTIRNQNSAEAYDSLNTQARTMRVPLATPINLAQDQDTYITFLVRQDTGGLLASQLSSPNRTLSLELRNVANQNQYDFTFFGQQTDFGIRSQADAAGQDVTADGFAVNATYLFVGKISGNGAGANKLQASLFANGSAVGNFTDPAFQWMLTANGGANFNPTITQLQFTSLYEGNFTVGNIWTGSAADFFAASAMGDFNGDGVIDGADLARWEGGVGAAGSPTHWQGNADGDFDVDGADFLAWQRLVGSPAGATATENVPEPATSALMALALLFTVARCRGVGGCE